jgi:hypothetical protein
MADDRTAALEREVEQLRALVQLVGLDAGNVGIVEAVARSLRSRDIRHGHTPWQRWDDLAGTDRMGYLADAARLLKLAARLLADDDRVRADVGLDELLDVEIAMELAWPRRSLQ